MKNRKSKKFETKIFNGDLDDLLSPGVLTGGKPTLNGGNMQRKTEFENSGSPLRSQNKQEGSAMRNTSYSSDKKINMEADPYKFNLKATAVYDMVKEEPLFEISNQRISTHLKSEEGISNPESPGVKNMRNNKFSQFNDTQIIQASALDSRNNFQGAQLFRTLNKGNANEYPTSPQNRPDTRFLYTGRYTNSSVMQADKIIRNNQLITQSIKKQHQQSDLLMQSQSVSVQQSNQVVQGLQKSGLLANQTQKPNYQLQFPKFNTVNQSNVLIKDFHEVKPKFYDITQVGNNTNKKKKQTNTVLRLGRPQNSQNFFQLQTQPQQAVSSLTNNQVQSPNQNQQHQGLPQIKKNLRQTSLGLNFEDSLLIESPSQKGHNRRRSIAGTGGERSSMLVKKAASPSSTFQNEVQSSLTVDQPVVHKVKINNSVVTQLSSNKKKTIQSMNQTFQASSDKQQKLQEVDSGNLIRIQEENSLEQKQRQSSLSLFLAESQSPHEKVIESKNPPQNNNLEAGEIERDGSYLKLIKMHSPQLIKAKGKPQMAALIDDLRNQRHLVKMNHSYLDNFANRKQAIQKFYQDSQMRPELPFTVARREPGKMQLGFGIE